MVYCNYHLAALFKHLNSFAKYISVLIILPLLPAELPAIPEFALWTGNACMKCHIDPKGGSMRNDFGWQFGRDAALFLPEEFRLDEIYNTIDKSKYSYFDGLLAFGLDTRFQYARSFKIENAKARFFPMQASFYGNSKPFGWLLFSGQYNFGPKIFKGQQNWSASITLTPDIDFPSLKAGFFQPSFGLRQCDMTSLDRRVVSSDQSEVLIAPDYAEYGVEMYYGSLEWMHVWAGAFDSKSLSEIGLFGEQVPLIPVKNNPSYTGKLMLFPHNLMEFLPSCYLGASALINNVNKTDYPDSSENIVDTVFNISNFNYWSLFCGFALLEDLFIFAEYDSSNKPYSRYTHNAIGGISYILTKGITLGLRAEKGTTELIFSESDILKQQITQAVLNARIILMPYVELMPEYRYMKTEEYEATRWDFQIHLYY